MNAERIISLLGKELEAMQTELCASLRSDVPLLNSINEDLISRSGKMLRPTVALAFAKACNYGACTPESIRYAAAVEILHNATLLHDDVADQAPFRRGAPTVFSSYGPTPAVLVGDFWLSRAVDLLRSSANLSWIIGAFSKTLTDLAEGEMLQQQKAFLADTCEEDYLRIVYCKTASLFVTACTSAVKSVGGSDAYMEAAEAYGKALGIAFQIRDDIIDYASTDSGKPAGIDLMERKITLPLLGAMKNSEREEEARALVRGINTGNDSAEDSAKCERLHAFVLENGGLDYALGRLRDYVREACEALEVLPDSAEKELLREIAEYNLQRTK